MFKLSLPRRRLLPGIWRFPEINLPLARMRIDFPEVVSPPWQEIEVERVLVWPLKADTLAIKVIFPVKG